MPNNTDLNINRKSFLTELEILAEDHQKQNLSFSLLLININNFRNLNTIFGYKECDILLSEFSDRIKSSVRQQDKLFRTGNADFVLIIPSIVNQGLASLAAIKIKDLVSEPFLINGNAHCLNINIGITFYPENSNKIETLLKTAERALHKSRLEPESYSVFTGKEETNQVAAWNLELELKNAQDNDEFELYFQPQISMQTGMLFGAEALIRWKSQNNGFIRPDIFIPIAEQNGQIHNITWWTINAALRLINDWPEDSIPLKIAINLSTKVLSDPDFIDSVNSAINIWNTDHERLIFEITESALMEDMSVSFKTINKLKSMGIRISIDDFGTGYSSMAYFKNIPANELKIDQSFIFNMLENDMDRHIVKTIIKMAHGFDLSVVAEGIEDNETYESLKAMGCDIAQGYYLAKPMPQHEFIEWTNNFKGMN